MKRRDFIKMLGATFASSIIGCQSPEKVEKLTEKAAKEAVEQFSGKTAHIPFDSDNRRVPLAPHELIIELLKENKGVELGESHEMVNILKFLSAFMENFKAAGVRQVEVELPHIVATSVGANKTPLLHNIQEELDLYVMMNDEEARRFREKHRASLPPSSGKTKPSSGKTKFLYEMFKCFEPYEGRETEFFSEANKYITALSKLVRISNPHLEDSVVESLTGYMRKTIDEDFQAVRHFSISSPLLQLMSQTDRSSPFFSLIEKVRQLNVNEPEDKKIRILARDIFPRESFISPEKYEKIGPVAINDYWKEVVEQSPRKGKSIALSGFAHIEPLGKEGLKEIGIGRLLGRPSIVFLHGQDGAFKAYDLGKSYNAFYVTMPSSPDREISSFTRNFSVKLVATALQQSFKQAEKKGYNFGIDSGDATMLTTLAIVQRVLYAERPDIWNEQNKPYTHPGGSVHPFLSVMTNIRPYPADTTIKYMVDRINSDGCAGMAHYLTGPNDDIAMLMAQFHSELGMWKEYFINIADGIPMPGFNGNEKNEEPFPRVDSFRQRIYKEQQKLKSSPSIFSK